MRTSLWIVTCILLVALTTFFVGYGNAQKTQDPYAPLKRFSAVLGLVENHYVRQAPRDELIDGAIQGMLHDLDPHSDYMPPEVFQEMQVDNTGKFEGIGIVITSRNETLVVISPIEDTPGFKAGIKAGDIILKIDDAPTMGISLMEAVKQLRGPRGTSVRLTILHKDAKAPEEVVVIRDVIKVSTAKVKELETGYLHVRLTRFNENTSQAMHEGIKQYARRQKIQGIILDLRNNPGGLLTQATSISDTFLPSGTIVYTKGRSPDSRQDFTAKQSATDMTVPLVVLINAGSASASEIVAGALQDHGRAYIMGERSFGKGSVQTVIDLQDGSGIKLTTALYYTPQGRSIQALGIEPDLVYPVEKKKRGSMATQFYRESDLTGHLETSDTAQAVYKKQREAQTTQLAADKTIQKLIALAKPLLDAPPAGQAAGGK